MDEDIHEMDYYNRNKVRVLFLAANPRGTTFLDVAEEIYQIDEEFLKATYRHRFVLEPKFAVRLKDLSRHFMQYDPHIIHISAHGEDVNREILFLDDNKKPVSATPEAVAELINNATENVRCVVLSACYSNIQAEEISQFVDCVIGMSDKIKQSSAIAFAQGFYRALGNGKSLKKSYSLGKSQIKLLKLPDVNIPDIISKDKESEDKTFRDLF